MENVIFKLKLEMYMEVGPTKWVERTHHSLDDLILIKYFLLPGTVLEY